MGNRAAITLLVALVLGSWGVACRAADPALGSADYRPTPEHPFGWRGDGTGRFVGATPPTDWSAKRNVVWSVVVGNGYSSPVLAGDSVVVAAEPDLLICLSRADGKERWRVRTTPADLADAKSRAAASEYQAPQDGSGMSAATPVTDGTSIYMVFANGIVRCVGLDGVPKWIAFIDTQQNTAYGRSASPILAAGKLIVHVTNLYALDPASGRQIWVNSEALSGYGTPLALKLGGTDVVVTPAGDVVRVSDGKSVNTGIGTCQYASPIAEGDTIYFAGATLAAVRLSPAFKEKELWNATIAGDIYSSPLLHDGALFVASGTGELFALDTRAADPSKPVIDARSVLGGSTYASVTMAGSCLFITSLQGETVVLDATREAREVAKNTLPAGTGASPIFSGKDLFLRDGDRLICVRKP